MNYLPTTLEVSGKAYRIRTDYRIVLNIFSAFEDNDLDGKEKCYVLLKCLYVDYDSIPREHLEDAKQKALWFIGGGNIPKSTVDFKTLDWEKDEHIIFPALSKAAGYEVRSVQYLHWWIVVGLFNEVSPDGLFSQVMAIRSKIARGKNLDKWEIEFYNQNRRMIDLNALTDEQEREDEELIKRITGEI